MNTNKKCKKKMALQKHLSSNKNSKLFCSDKFRQKRLPENFAEKVLALELELEKPQIDIDVVN